MKKILQLAFSSLQNILITIKLWRDGTPGLGPPPPCRIGGGLTFPGTGVLAPVAETSGAGGAPALYKAGDPPGVVIQNGAPVGPDPSPNQNLILSHFVQILLLPYFRYFCQRAQTIYHTIGCHQVELWHNQTIKTT